MTLAVMLALAFDTDAADADLFVSGGRFVNDGYDVETLAIVSLLSDAPAQPGDVLPEGTPRRGWWADVLDEQGRVLGSRLWLLEQSESTEATAQRAKSYAAEALQWMLDERIISKVAFETEVYDEDVGLAVDLTARDGRETRIGFFVVT